MKEIRIMNIDERLKPIAEAIERTPIGDIKIDIVSNDYQLTAYENEDGTYFCSSERRYGPDLMEDAEDVASKDIFKLLGYALTRKDRQL